MAICPVCNAVVEDGATFCTNCGAQLSQSATTQPNYNNTNTQYGAQNSFAQQPQYYAPAPQYAPPAEAPVSIGDWVLSFFVMCIPVVNIIMMFVWAFSSGTNKSKSNFFKAQLIIWLVITLISIIAAVVLVSAGFSLIGYFSDFI